MGEFVTIAPICLNVPGLFSGRIINRENIGKSSDQLVTMWNEQYPEDQVVFSQN